MLYFYEPSATFTCNKTYQNILGKKIEKGSVFGARSHKLLKSVTENFEKNIYRVGLQLSQHLSNAII